MLKTKVEIHVPNEGHKDNVTDDYAYNRFVPALAPGIRETIAQAIHEAYQHARRGQTHSHDPSIAPWDKLPDYLKKSNRRQADHIFDKLRRVGCSVHKARHHDVARMTFTEDEIEVMAEMEHDRWNTERLLEGWKWGKKRDATSKVNPYLVPWTELPDNIKERDRETVRKIPEFLAKVGLEIRRVQEITRQGS